MKNDTNNCPSCKSSSINLLESINIHDLDKLYKCGFNYSVRELFSEMSSIDFCQCKKCDLRYFTPMVAGTQEFYEYFQNFDWYYFDDKPEFLFAKEYIKDDDDVLEIGAGKGAFSKIISTMRYTGLEFSQNAIEVANKNGVNLISQSIEDYSKTNNNKHDVVCNFQVLEHVCDVNSFLKSSIRCLKPGGTMIISVPSVDSFSRYVRNFTLDMPPHHLTRWTDLALRNIANEYGMKMVELHHEVLQEPHKLFYASTIFENALFSMVGKAHKNVDLGVLTRVIKKLSSILGNIFSKGLASNDLLPRGISTVAVYQKI